MALESKDWSSKIWRARRFTYPVVGMVLSFGSPFGWIALSSLTGNHSENFFLAYATISTGIVFATLGYLVGLMHDQLRQYSDTDPLTGLLNQKSFYRIAGHQFMVAARHDQPFAVMMMDIDHFKDVNDNHSHVFGSHILMEIGKIIDAGTRNSDIIARFGGDEFILGLPLTNSSETHLVAERIREHIENSVFQWKNYCTKVTISIGIAERTSSDCDDLMKLVLAADAALYEAKDMGRNCVVSDAA